MTQNSGKPVSRRSLIKAAVGAAGAVTLSSLGVARAQSKMAPSMVMYQGTPKDGHQCDACIQWKAPDACQIVDGKISPKGWCVAWAPKAK